MIFRMLSRGFFLICILWVLAVHLSFFVTKDVNLTETWIGPLRGTKMVYFAVALLFLQWFFVPCGLFLGLICLRPWVRSPSFFGVLAGLMVALWTNTELLAVGYCGVYTSLPGLMLGYFVSGGDKSSVIYFCSALVFNVLFWSVIGRVLAPFIPKILPEENG